MAPFARAATRASSSIRPPREVLITIAVDFMRSSSRVETMWRVSRALTLPLGALLAEDETPRVRAIPARTGEPLQAEAGMAAWVVHADAREHRSEVYELAFEVGVEQRGEPHLPGTEEVIVCTAGRMRAGPAPEPVALGPGDAVWFAADVAHVYTAEEDSRALCWMLYPTAAALG